MIKVMQGLRETTNRVTRSIWFAPGLIFALAFALLSAWLLLPSPSEARGKIQEALRNHEVINPVDSVAAYLPTALLLDLGFCVVLGLAWWRGRRALSARCGGGAGNVSSFDRRMLWSVVAATTLLSGVFNAPRLQVSLWGDEVLTMRNFVVGRVKRVKKNNKLHVERIPWTDTVFGYWRPNNHVLYSVAARLSHEAWPRNRSRTAPYFNETALRLPSFLAGLAAFGMLAALALRLGLPRVGMAAVVLLALHPWHVRFGTEARGYAFLLLLTPALLLCTVEGARTGRWRWWLVSGIIAFLLLYSNPLSLHVILPAVLSGLLLALTQWKTGRDRVTVLARMAAGGLLAAILCLPLMLPLLPQVRPFMEKRSTAWQIDQGWVRDALAEMFTGVVWHKYDPSNPYTRPWEQVAGAHPWIIVGGSLGLGIVLLAGVTALWRHSTVTRCLLPALLLPSLVLTLTGVVKGLLVVHYYLVIGLPGLIFVMAAGTAWLAQACVPRARSARWTPAVVCGLACIPFGVATHHQREIMRKLPLEPRREAASVFHETLNPKDARMDDVVSAGFLPDRAYDPGVYVVENSKEIQDLAEMAAGMGRPFYVTCTQYLSTRWGAFPEAFGFVENSGLFERVATLYGTWEEFSIVVYRYRGRER
jgi:hypothetical protein